MLPQHELSTMDYRWGNPTVLRAIPTTSSHSRAPPVTKRTHLSSTPLSFETMLTHHASSQDPSTSCSPNLLQKMHLQRYQLSRLACKLQLLAQHKKPFPPPRCYTSYSPTAISSTLQPSQAATNAADPAYHQRLHKYYVSKKLTTIFLYYSVSQTVVVALAACRY